MFFLLTQMIRGDDERTDVSAVSSLRMTNRTLLLCILGYSGFTATALFLYWIAGCSYQGPFGAVTTCTVSSLERLVQLTNVSPLLHMAIIFVGMPLWICAALGFGSAGIARELHECRVRHRAPLPCMVRSAAFYNVLLACFAAICIIVVLAVSAGAT
jgi:hypothetical protein